MAKSIDDTNKDNIYFEIKNELSDYNNDSTQWSIQRISESNTSREKMSTNRKQQGHEQSTNRGYGSINKSPDFFQGNKSSTNFLSKILCDGINKEDFYNENFIFDIYLLVTKKLNPFLLDRKLEDQNKHQMIYMLWKEWIPQKFNKHICKDSNFLYLKCTSTKSVRNYKWFLNEGKENYIELRKNYLSTGYFSVRLFKCISRNLLFDWT